MDKSKAIELLKQALTEIPNLKELHYNNQKFKLWRDKVGNIIRAALDSDDSKTFSSARPSVGHMAGMFPDSVYQEDYLKEIAGYETALLSIIQKYEILGFGTAPEAKVEPPGGIRDREKSGKELELTLEGTPDMILECIRSTIEKLNSQGYTYDFRRTSGRPDYTTWDKTYFASCAISQGDEGQIGTIRLQLLPQERTLFKFLEPKDWGSSFGHFLNSLFAQFQELGFVDFKGKKPAAMAKAQESTAELPLHIFDNMQFHPRIIRASKSLFNSGHYAEAIFAAFKAVNNFAKKKVGLSLDGKDLMAKAFNEDKPIIKLNKLLTKSERDEQEGFRFLFMGAMVGIRNPKAHDDIRQIDPYRTLEYLAFASLLMRRVTEGKLESENK